MQRRRVMLAVGKKSRLPAEYQEVEYLESTAVNQYIATGFIYSSSGSLEIKAFIPVGTNWVAGARVSLGKQELSVLCDENFYSKFYFRYGNNTWDYTSLTSTERANPITFSLDGNLGTVKTVSRTLTHTFTANSFETPDGMYLFACNNNKSLIASGFGVRIYYCKFAKTGFGRDLVPCYRKSDSKPGMYDLYGNRFYTNAGPGDFAVGPNVN